MQNQLIGSYAWRRFNSGIDMKWLWVCSLLVCSLNVSAQTLRVGFGTNKPPYIFESEARGLEHDIVMAAAQRGGMEPVANFAPMERLSLMLSKGQLDVIATTNERSGGAIFYSDVYIRYQNVAVALRARNLDIQRISDLVGYSVNAFQRARFLLGSEFEAMAANNPRYREEALSDRPQPHALQRSGGCGGVGHAHPALLQPRGVYPGGCDAAADPVPDFCAY